MTDRELLELAAKAAGIDAFDWDDNYGAFHNPPWSAFTRRWNPLTDDGDALRLAVKLRLVIDADLGEVLCPHEPARGVHYAAPTNTESIRRAIVRAAAELGR